MYCPDSSGSSIYYEGTEENLEIQLLFREVRDAEEFQTKLNTFASEHHHFFEKLRLERHIETVNLTEELDRVFRTDYIADDTDSPMMSLNDVLSGSATVVSMSGDTSRTLQALEDTSVVARLGSKWYKCHLIPASSRDNLKDDPDNIIYASWLFHQHLDGLHTETGIGLAISLDPDSQPTKEEVAVNDNYEERYKVVVLIHFEAVELASIFQTLFKHGTEKLNDTCWRSFVHVRSVDKFSKCITSKLLDSKKKSPWVESLNLV